MFGLFSDPMENAYILAIFIAEYALNFHIGMVLRI